MQISDIFVIISDKVESYPTPHPSTDTMPMIKSSTFTRIFKNKFVNIQ